MNKNEIKEAIATVSDSGISPYDLLLALGNKDVVPQNIIEDRKSRVLNRDGKETSSGYIKNAIEDLSKMTFKGKDQVLKLLKLNLDKGFLSGLNEEASRPSWILPFFILLSIGVFYFYAKSQIPL